MMILLSDKDPWKKVFPQFFELLTEALGASVYCISADRLDLEMQNFHVLESAQENQPVICTASGFGNPDNLAAIAMLPCSTFRLTLLSR